MACSRLKSIVRRTNALLFFGIDDNGTNKCSALRGSNEEVVFSEVTEGKRSR